MMLNLYIDYYYQFKKVNHLFDYIDQQYHEMFLYTAYINSYLLKTSYFQHQKFLEVSILENLFKIRYHNSKIYH